MKFRFWISIIFATISFQSASAETQPGNIWQVLQLEMTLNKTKVRVGDKMVARFKITNISNKPITFIKTGALYDAFWFDVRTEDQRIVRPERQLEMLATGRTEPDDFVTLRPGTSFNDTIEGAIRASKDKPGEILLNFWDSHFGLECGRMYSISGLFWAREDKSGRAKVISGDISSKPQQLQISPCQ